MLRILRDVESGNPPQEWERAHIALAANYAAIATHLRAMHYEGRGEGEA